MKLIDGLLVLKPIDDPQYKAYNPTVVEFAWYAWREMEGFFIPKFKEDGKVKDEGSFIIVEPPPKSPEIYTWVMPWEMP